MTLFVGRSKRNPGVPCCPYQLTIGRHRLGVRNCFRKRHRDYVGGLKRDHYTSFTSSQNSYSASTEIGRQHAIKSIRPAAPLQVAQYHAANLSTGQSLELHPAIYTDSTKTRRMICITLVLIDSFVTYLHGAFRYHNYAEVGSGFIARSDFAGDGLHRELDLRNENHIGAPGDARMQRNPAGIPAHHLEDHHAFVRLSRGMQPIKRFSRNIQCGSKSKS